MEAFARLPGFLESHRRQVLGQHRVFGAPIKEPVQTLRVQFIGGFEIVCTNLTFIPKRFILHGTTNCRRLTPAVMYCFIQVSKDMSNETSMHPGKWDACSCWPA